MHRTGIITTAGITLGACLLIAPAVLMVMALTGGRSELPGGGCGTTASVAGDAASPDELSREQLANAAAIISVGARMRVPRQAVVIALATAHQESRFLNYANDGVGGDLKPDQRGIARSLNLPHQAVGSDHGSMGIFQQQWPWWGTMPELMNPATAAAKFYERLLQVPNWWFMTVTQAAQRVQRSAYPDAYADDEALAVELLGDPGLASGSVEQAVWTGDTAGVLCGAQPAYSGTVVMPLQPSARFTDLQNFGAQGGRWSNGHTGTDLSAACGTPVRAAHDGRIVLKTDEPWSGPWLVQVGTGAGSLTTWYAHMQAVDVVNGQLVRAGQQIGEVGSEGNSSGCHLHFEVHPNGGSIYEDDVDPTDWLELHAASISPQIQTVSSGSPRSFVIATFNLLGHSHTAPGGNRPGWHDSRTRLRWAIDLLDRYAVEVVGLQEFEPVQRRSLLALAGDRYAIYSPNGDTANSIAWRRDRWAFVSADSFTIPYHGGQPKDMPILRLRSLATGGEAIFVNIHNPADTARHPGQERFRLEATRREVVAINSLLEAYDLPIYLTGDFNERRSAFCTFTRGGVLTASAGGSNTGRCRPPERPQIDWIFGSQRATWTAHSVVRRGVTGRITDHPLVVASGIDTASGEE